MRSGIYKIINTSNKKEYIGSSINIERRIKFHISCLKRGKHHSSHLQNAWNKYGEDKFKFEVICYCDKNNLLTIEQSLINYINPEYNSAESVYKPGKRINFNKEKYKNDALNRLKENPKFGWISKSLKKIDKDGNTIKEYKSLKEYAIEHSCSIATVSICLKNNYKCAGYNIIKA